MSGARKVYPDKDGIHRTKSLINAVCEGEIKGQLSADWVEWLMGYPVGWTDLDRVLAELVQYDIRTEPNIPRLAVGQKKRIARLRGLGNAVVPQVVELIAWKIKDWEDRENVG